MFRGQNFPKRKFWDQIRRFMLKPNAKRSIEDIFETTIQSTYKI